MIWTGISKEAKDEIFWNMSVAKTISRREETSLIGKAKINGLNDARNDSTRIHTKLLSKDKAPNGSNGSSAMENGERRRNGPPSPRFQKPLNGYHRDRDRNCDNSHFDRSRPYVNGSEPRGRFLHEADERRRRFDRDNNNGNRSRDSSMNRSRRESQRFPSRPFNNGLNRHELQSWNRDSRRTNFKGRSRSRSPDEVQRTDSALSKQSSSNITSSSSPVSDSSVKGRVFKTKDSKDSKTESSSSSSPTSADDSLTKKPVVKESTPLKSVSPKPEVVQAQPTPPVSLGDWTIQTSKGSGKQYYYNTKTKVSQWTKPEELIELEKKASAKSRTPSVEKVVPLAEPAPIDRPDLKRRISCVGSPQENVPPPKVTKVQPDLLGSPISDDGEESAASPTQSEQMDISDNGSRASASPSRNAPSTTTKSTPVKCGQSTTVKEPQTTVTDVKTKAPTVENLKRLRASEDPEKRRTEKLQRVTKWMSSLDNVTVSPATEVVSPPVIKASEPGSPVSSSEFSCPSPVKTETSAGSRKSPVKKEPQEEPVPRFPWSTCSIEVSLPPPDLPDVSDLPKDLAAFLDLRISEQFRTSRLSSLEDHRNRIVTDGRTRAYSCSGEKSIAFKAMSRDISQKRITMSFQSNDIAFLSSLEEELSRTDHSRDNRHDVKFVPKTDLVLHDVKMET